MKWIIGLVMMGSSGYYLYRDYQKQIAERPAVQAQAPEVKTAPAPMLADAQLVELRKAAFSADKGVRLAAIQSLFALSDPKIMLILEQAMTTEPDPEVRVTIVLLLKTSTDRGSLKVLGLGVHDVDPTVRVASLRVLSEVGDLTNTGVVAEAAADADDGVKLQAMDTLSHLQERRKAQYEELSQQLRRQYEEQVKKSRENAG
jgi:hypothetical protein